MRDQVFICYSREDEAYLQMLHNALKINKTIVAWSDTKIRPGQDWKKEIDTALARTKVALLLVSADFLASDFIMKHELPTLLTAANNGEVTILWIAVRPCWYQESELSRLQSIIEPSKPLSGMSRTERENTIVKICKMIKDVIA